jgi:hypothetical protein
LHHRTANSDWNDSKEVPVRSFLSVFCIVLMGVLLAVQARAQDSLNMRVAARLQADWGNVNHLVTVGHYAYAATATRGLQVADIESPSAPVLLGGDSSENFHHLCVVGDRLYATVGNSVDVAELRIFSLANPAAPVILGRVALPQGPGCVAVAGNYAYIARMSHMITVVYVQDPAEPVCVASVGTYGLAATGIAIEGNRLYIAATYLAILDITIPAWPVPLNYFVIGEPWVLDIAVRNGLVYTVDDWEGLKVWNTNDAQNPLLVGAYETQIMRYDAFGTLALLPDDRLVISNGQALEFVGVSDPARPALLATRADPSGCVVTSGNQLVTTSPAISLALYDIAGLPSILPAGSAAYLQPLQSAVVSDSRIYALDGQWLWCLDATTPAPFTRLGRIATSPTAYASNICVLGNIVYLKKPDSDQLQIVDATDPAAMTTLAWYSWSGQFIVGYGNCLYGEQAGDLVVLDVSNPALPVQATVMEDCGSWAMTVAGGRLYVNPYNQGLKVYDLSVPTNPQLIGQYNPGDISLGDVHGTRAYLPYQVGDFWTGVRVVDFADPADPQVVGQWETNGYNQLHVSPNCRRLYSVVGDTLKVESVSDSFPYPEIAHYVVSGTGYSRIQAVTDDYCYIVKNGILRQLEITAPDAVAEITPAVPTAMTLDAYPNPFNATTQIQFTLPTAGQVTLIVYDLLGREVAILERGVLTAGTHVSTFDGSGLASGLYILRLEAGSHTSCAKIALLK